MVLEIFLHANLLHHTAARAGQSVCITYRFISLRKSFRRRVENVSDVKLQRLFNPNSFLEIAKNLRLPSNKRKKAFLCHSVSQHHFLAWHRRAFSGARVHTAPRDAFPIRNILHNVCACVCVCRQVFRIVCTKLKPFTEDFTFKRIKIKQNLKGVLLLL